MIAKSHRWHETIKVAASVAFLGLYGLNAAALSLGRLTVQSALGEPLRAEIDIPEINAGEAASLRIGLASVEAFRAAGLEYNPAMGTLETTLQRRPDGSAYLRLRTDRPINDPFVDMILEANWATGRVARDYTMLFDPVGLHPAAPVAPTPAQIPAPASVQPPPAPVPPPEAVPVPESRTPAPQTVPVKPIPAATAPGLEPRQAVAKPPVPRSIVKPSAVAGRQVIVKSGDTAGKIAASVKHASVSLDQMLVALLRANPDAFIHDNVNRIKSGAILNVPTVDQAQSTSAVQATQIIFAQSKNFNDFRRGLAGNAPSTRVATAQRSDSGKVQTQVQDKKPAPLTPDKLTLSKGALKGVSPESQVAQSRSAKEVASRAAEIAKNLSELNQLRAASSAIAARPSALPGSAAVRAAPGLPAPVVTAVPAPVAPKMAVSKPAAAVAAVASMPKAVASAVPTASVAPAPALASAASAAAAAAAADAASAASAAAAAASAASAAAAALPAMAASAASPAPVVAVAPSEAPPAESSWLDDLMQSPLALAAAGGLLALLAGFGFYYFKRRKTPALADSTFLESRLQPDSFFDASGGQSVDTSDSPATGSSLVYSPSQLDAVDDVDPVAEADVYLAYGRDLQAEEILKDALRNNPARLAIHHKLLEIYATRRDAKAYQSTAELAFKASQGGDSDWAHICEVGLNLDPDNALYQPGGRPGAGSSAPVPLDFSPNPLGFKLNPLSDAQAQATQVIIPSVVSSTDLDLDLDFSFDQPATSTADEPKLETQPVASGTAPAASSNARDLDFDLHTSAHAAPELRTEDTVQFSVTVPGSATDGQRAGAADKLDFEPQVAASPAPVSTAAVAPEAKPDFGMLEFDLDSISLDLGTPAKAEAETVPAPNEVEDPLATKLALAQEFRSLGDDDGARALIEEVISEATGDMRVAAQRALSQL